MGTISTTDAKIPFKMRNVQAPVFRDQSFDIRNYGAIGDGKTLNTRSFADAIAQCNSEGGGRVVVPAGKWLTGAIHLKSNVNLQLDKGSEIIFSANPNDYLPVVFTRWEGFECYNYSPFIYANGCRNIAITGSGKLNGQGEKWWPWNQRKREAADRLYDMACNGAPVSERVFGTIKDAIRPSFVQPLNCKNVLIEGITVVNGPMWTVHLVYCDGVLIRNVRIITEGPNGDGIVPDSSRNVVIEDSFLSTGDDCIVLKSGMNEDGWRVGKPTENVVVRRVHTQRGHGGVVMGSDTSGGIRNVFVYDCFFDGTQRGVRMKTMPGRGGVIENIYFDNIKVRGGDVAVHITMLYGSSTVKPKTQAPPTVRNIHISNITCDGCGRVAELVGWSGNPMTDVTLDSIQGKARRGVWCSDVNSATLKNLQFSTEVTPDYCFVNCQDLSLSGARAAEGSDIFLSVQGDKTQGIKLTGCDWSASKAGIVKNEDVKEGSVVISN